MAIIEEDVDIEEQTAYGDKVPSLKEITLQHIKKISGMICQELTPGYWDEKPMKTSTGVVITKTYNPDLRIAYCNAIDFLMDITYPWADKDYRDAVDSHYKDEDTIKEINDKVKKKKIMFRETNKMFERIGYFEASDIGHE